MKIKNSIIKITAVSLLALSVSMVSSTAFTPDAAAQEAVEGRQFGSAAGQVVNDAQTLAQSEQYGAAIGKLNEALALEGLNPYERSTIHSMLGAYYYEQDNLAMSLRSYENAINAGGLLPNEVDSYENNIAQLMIANGQYVEGANRLEAWVRKTGNNDPKYTQYIMQAWVQAEEYRKALPWAEKWFNSANPKERKHFDLLNFLYNDLGMQGRQADIIKEMIVRWPEDQNLWESWISLLGNGGREKDAFEVNKMRYLAGAMTSEKDIKKIVDYYQYYEMPYQAARIMQNEINAGRVQKSADNLVIIADLFRGAREYKKALPYLKEAAEKSGKSKSWANYGEALYQQGQCGEAETALRKAMDMGYDRGKSWMLIANCRYEQGQKEERPSCDQTPEQRLASAKVTRNKSALEAFSKVPATAKDYRSAQKWVDFVTNENRSYETRCEEKIKIAKDLCMIKIENAYKLEIIRGGFSLDEEDQNCMVHKEEYDELYTVKKSDE